MSARDPIVVVGGGPAGLATARAYRAAGGDAPVVLLAAEDRVPYRRPPLTKEYLRGELEEHELAIEPPEWFAEHGVELRHARVGALDAERRAVTTELGDELRYSSCVLATGSEPVRLPVPGADDPEVMTVRTVEDSRRLAAAGRAGSRVAVVGSGFIGCEAAASLAMRGAEVTVVTDEPAPQAGRLGEEAGERLAGWLREAGVRLMLGAPVAAIARARDGSFEVSTDADERVAADAVALGAGVRPRVELARNAGIEIADEGAVAVDAGLATSADGVLAAGDVACPQHPRAGRRLRVEHWGEALNHGEVAGRQLAGDVAATWDPAPGFWSQIGAHTVKLAGWGDGFDEARLIAGDGGAFTVWYGRDGVTVGVLTHERDEDYERGRERVELGEPLP